MDQSLRPSSLVPEGFLVERTTFEPDRVVVWVRSRQLDCACPACGVLSRRVHSRYLRRAADLPLSGRRVGLRVMVRRFRCAAVLCGRQVFSERFANGVLPPLARRTGRLEHIVHHLGLALGGRPAASFAERLMLPVQVHGAAHAFHHRALDHPVGEIAVTRHLHRPKWRCCINMKRA